MDIELGSGYMSGINLAKKINSANPNTQIIFINQHLKYASSVYETNHVYFVYKQQMAEYLPKALSTACQKLYNLREQYFYFCYLSRNYRLLRSDIPIWNENCEIPKYEKETVSMDTVHMNSLFYSWTTSCIKH